MQANFGRLLRAIYCAGRQRSRRLRLLQNRPVRLELAHGLPNQQFEPVPSRMAIGSAQLSAGAIMKPTVKVAAAATPDGGEMVLYQHDQDFLIKVNHQDLMTSRQHESELELARLGCGHLQEAAQPSVLIAGMGMGYTIRQTLDLLAGCELFACLFQSPYSGRRRTIASDHEGYSG